MRLVNTPYDDVFRTLLNDCSVLILPVINEMFGEHYIGKEKIVFSINEHFLNSQDGNETERITDTSFTVIGTEVKKYHWECQSSPDSSMLVRFFEYDTQIALDEGKIEGNMLSVTFPHSAALFRRHHESTPDKLKTEIITPGGSVRYDIPIMKLQFYNIDEIFKKKLLFLIPFYIFSYEKHFEEYNNDKQKLELLMKEYEKIKNRLEELVNAGDVNEYTKCTIIDMSNKVLEHIAMKYNDLREGVKSVMGGKVLEYEAKSIRNEGIQEGLQRGIQKGMQKGIQQGMQKGIQQGRGEGVQVGRLEMLFDLVRDNLLPVKDAAYKAGLSEEDFREKMQTHTS